MITMQMHDAERLYNAIDALCTRAINEPKVAACITHEISELGNVAYNLDRAMFADILPKLRALSLEAVPQNDLFPLS